MTGGHIDQEVVERRLAHLIDSVEVLRDYHGMTVERLASSPKTYWVVEHGLQICIQAVLDIAAHLVAALDGPIGDEYKDHILALVGLGILPSDFARRIAPMVGFRNIVVHDYLEVDLSEVHRVLGEHLDDFILFAAYVREFLDKHE